MGDTPDSLAPLGHSSAPWPTVCPGKVSERDPERQKAGCRQGLRSGPQNGRLRALWVRLWAVCAWV